MCNLRWFTWLSLTVSIVISNGLGIRRNVADLTQRERDSLLQALYAMKNSPSKWDPSFSAYDYYVRVHEIAFPENQFGHLRWSFFPWHRAFLKLFEAEVREYYDSPNASDFFLPYWDPTSEQSTWATLCDETFLGGNGDPIGGWSHNSRMSLSCEKWALDPRFVSSVAEYNHSCLSRKFGQSGNVSQLPSASDWYSPIYDEKLAYDVAPYFSPNMTTAQIRRSFRARTEGDSVMVFNTSRDTHGALHNYIGGHIVEPNSPNDPVFFLLHGWIDLMWALFQDQWKDWAYYTFPLQFEDLAVLQLGHEFEFFNNSQFTSRNVMDHRVSLGYRYDVQSDDSDSDSSDAKWYSVLGESPWYELLIALSVFVVGIVVGCAAMKWYIKSADDRYRKITESSNGLELVM